MFFFNQYLVKYRFLKGKLVLIKSVPAKNENSLKSATKYNFCGSESFRQLKHR